MFSKCWPLCYVWWSAFVVFWRLCVVVAFGWVWLRLFCCCAVFSVVQFFGRVFPCLRVVCVFVFFCFFHWGCFFRILIFCLRSWCIVSCCSACFFLHCLLHWLFCVFVCNCVCCEDFFVDDIAQIQPQFHESSEMEKTTRGSGEEKQSAKFWRSGSSRGADLQKHWKINPCSKKWTMKKQKKKTKMTKEKNGKKKTKMKKKKKKHTQNSEITNKTSLARLLPVLLPPPPSQLPPLPQASERTVPSLARSSPPPPPSKRTNEPYEKSARSLARVPRLPSERATDVAFLLIPRGNDKIGSTTPKGENRRTKGRGRQRQRHPQEEEKTSPREQLHPQGVQVDTSKGKFMFPWADGSLKKEGHVVSRPLRIWLLQQEDQDGERRPQCLRTPFSKQGCWRRIYRRSPYDAYDASSM